MTGKNGQNQVLVPTLRFPEFREAEPWTLRELSKLLSEPKKKNRDMKYGPEHVLSVSGEWGCVNQIELMGRSYAGASVREYNVVETGDIVYTKSPLKACPSGIIKANKGATGIVSVLYAVYRPTVASRSDFLDHYFSSDHKLNTYLQPLVKKGPKNSILVNSSDVLKGRIAVPDVAEQQKIAECLSSLDTLIVSEVEKLTALREHKRGLLNQLFPAEGKTIPSLRFSEYRDVGAWEERSLAEIGRLIGGLTYSPSDVRDKGLLVLRSSNVQNGKIDLSDCVFVDPNVNGANIAKADDILICVRNGSTSLIGKNALIPDGMPLCTHGAFMTIFRSRLASFVFQLFQTTAYQRQVAADLGATINSINSAQFLRYKFLVPIESEQQKIADCLSSIDTLIDVQRERTDALKMQKNGLLQQLFPSSDEAVA
ncbi:restriction endonuclease subunit S [Sphingomonas faeni]|uniref:restriction endonuclease subunit S n=1 Tax=Sphingomonas faeni TaxID=185950 RepID=UPI003358A63B